MKSRPSDLIQVVLYDLRILVIFTGRLVFDLAADLASGAERHPSRVVFRVLLDSLLRGSLGLSSASGLLDRRSSVVVGFAVVGRCGSSLLCSPLGCGFLGSRSSVACIFARLGIRVG